jgi:uncharacterized membrane protein
MLASALDIFTRDGWAYLSRWSHVFVGITWIGLLYYFNFVQVPAFTEMEAAARNNAIDKLASRALWWFRWAAVATLVTGILILIFQRQYENDFFKAAPGTALYAAILLAVTMFLNVWLVIWPLQRRVIANARNVQAGGQADPEAAGMARRALMASRQNMIYSLPMLLFMVGTSHFDYKPSIIFFGPSGSSRAIFWIIWLVIWAALELNALGYLGGTEPGGPRVIYDNHQNAIITGFVYSLVAFLMFAFILRT